MTADGSAPVAHRGFYARRVFPRLMDVALGTAENRRIRAAVCEPLHGEVLEIGFGSGHNLPFLPPAVTRLLAVDPMQEGRALARKRLAASDVEVDFVGLDGQSIDLPDGSADAALSTWTLCSIPDAAAAVREIARVLRPGGVLHFVEHGLSPDAKVERWQHRLNPVQNRIACGCNIQRDIPALIESGGMTVDQLDRFYAKGDPKILGWTFQGRASVAGGS
jgi:ubiquinone/menaquinone biosynthesis C-methylase UbiE